MALALESPSLGDRPRSELGADEVAQMLVRLDECLQFMTVESQPEVAMRVLQLASDPTAGLLDYAEALKTDAVLTGRLLRLANSACYAQRRPVATVERACVLVGMERLRALSLGFYLTRAAAPKTPSEISRRIWGQSVMRGCLATHVAELRCPEHLAEAFVIGLMLDAGVPIALSYHGERYARLIEAATSPSDLFAREASTLLFTHVDVMRVLMRRWRLPEILAEPIVRRHENETPPRSDAASVGILCRIAQYVGALRLEDRTAQTAAMPELAARLLGLTQDELSDVFEKSVHEYSAIWKVFGTVVQPMPDLASLAVVVHNRLIEEVDQILAGEIRAEARRTPQRFTLGGSEVEICLMPDGSGQAYLCGENGVRMMSVQVRPGMRSASALCDTFGLTPEPGECETVDSFLRSAA